MHTRSFWIAEKLVQWPQLPTLYAEAIVSLPTLYAEAIVSKSLYFREEYNFRPGNTISYGLYESPPIALSKAPSFKVGVDEVHMHLNPNTQCLGTILRECIHRLYIKIMVIIMP